MRFFSHFIILHFSCGVNHYKNTYLFLYFLRRKIDIQNSLFDFSELIKIMKFRFWCFSWAPGNLYSLEFTILDTTGCPHMISWWSQSRVIFVKLNQCDKKSHFVNICHRLPPTRNGLSCLFTINFFESFVSSTRWGGLWWVRTLFIVATHILNVKMPTLGYLFEFDVPRCRKRSRKWFASRKLI